MGTTLGTTQGSIVGVVKGDARRSDYGPCRFGAEGLRFRL